MGCLNIYVCKVANFMFTIYHYAEIAIFCSVLPFARCTKPRQIFVAVLRKTRALLVLWTRGTRLFYEPLLDLLLAFVTRGEMAMPRVNLAICNSFPQRFEKQISRLSFLSDDGYALHFFITHATLSSA